MGPHEPGNLYYTWVSIWHSRTETELAKTVEDCLPTPASSLLPICGFNMGGDYVTE